MNDLEARVSEHFKTHSLEPVHHASVIIFCFTCFNLAMFVFLQSTSMLSPKRMITKVMRDDWNQRIIQTLNGCLILLGTGVCFVDVLNNHKGFYEPNINWLFGYSFAHEAFAAAHVGYLVFDMGVLIWYRKTLWVPMEMVHHVVFCAAIGFHLCNGCPYKVQMPWLGIGELTLLFLNFKWCLAVMGKNNTGLYVFNAVCLLVSFAFTRILFVAGGLLHAWHLMGAYKSVPIPYMHTQILYAVACGVLIMNIHWFLGVIRAVSRVLKRSGFYQNSKKGASKADKGGKGK